MLRDNQRLFQRVNIPFSHVIKKKNVHYFGQKLIGRDVARCCAAPPLVDDRLGGGGRGAAELWKRRETGMKNGKCGASAKKKEKRLSFSHVLAPSPSPPLGQTPLRQSN